jgi:ubiquinone/menaquinone biosynthesis C-methylase UbiE
MKFQTVLEREQDYWEAQTEFEWLSESGIRSILDIIPPVQGDVLEFCSGSGMFTRRITPTYDSYTCLDLSQAMLVYLYQRVPQIMPVVCNVEDPGFKRSSFDMVLVFAGLHHVPNENLAVQKAYDLLRPGGVFIAFEPNASCWYRKPMLKIKNLLKLYTQDERFLHPDDLHKKMELAGFVEIETRYRTPEYNPTHLDTLLNKFLSGWMHFFSSLNPVPTWQSFFVMSGKK